MVRRMNKPYKTAVSYGSRDFLGARTKPLFFYYCFSTVYYTYKPYKRAGAYGFLSFVTLLDSDQQHQLTGPRLVIHFIRERRVKLP